MDQDLPLLRQADATDRTTAARATRDESSTMNLIPTRRPGGAASKKEPAPAHGFCPETARAALSGRPVRSRDRKRASRRPTDESMAAAGRNRARAKRARAKRARAKRGRATGAAGKR